MKRLIVILIILIAPFAHAEQWCQWSGTEAENCLAVSGDGIIYPPNHFPVKIAGNETKINNYGYYLLVTTQPTIGANQTRDAEVWGFADNEISKTWTVRDLTATEIDQRTASPMSIEMYWVWKVFLDTGLITQAQAVERLPQEMIDAYLARKRLEGD